MIRPILMCIIFFTASVTAVQNYADDEVAAKKYLVCAGCHGFDAKGNKLVSAPSIAGQEVWYLQRQMNNYKDGVRGGEGDDVNGTTMATMINTLVTDADIEMVAKYINKLSAGTPEATLTGDAKKGEALYATCAACHGKNAEGNVALNSPALTGMDDWYMVAQLNKFKNGMRGKHPKDTYGMQMVPMMTTLKDEQALIDVATYINTLQAK